MKLPHKCRYRQGCLCILIFMENVDTTKRCDAHGKGHINREIFKKHLTLKLRYDIISTLTIWQRIKYAGVAELRQIFDLVVAELVPQHEIFDLVEAELVPQLDKC